MALQRCRGILVAIELGTMHYRGAGGPQGPGGGVGLAASQGLLRRSTASQPCSTTERAGQRPGGGAAAVWLLQRRRSDSEAQYRLGTMHHKGEGGPKDPAEARRLLGLAAAQGHAEAQYHLACMHYSGTGRPRDPQRRGGCFASQRRRSMLCRTESSPKCTFKGEGGPKDLAESRRLYGSQRRRSIPRRSTVLPVCSRRERASLRSGAAEARRLPGLAAAQGHAEACSSSSPPCTTGERAGQRTWRGARRL